MTKPVPSSLLTAALLSVVALTTLPPAQAASYTWTNTAGGNWNVAANWSPNGVPGGTDSAAITVTGGYTVTINDTESAGTLTLGASSGDGTVQTLNVSASTFTMNNASTGTAQGTLSVTGGTLAGTGALAIAGPLNWTGGAISSVVQFNGGSINGGLNLYGALINSGTLDWSGNLYMYGGVLTNLGTINLASGTSVSAESGSPVLNNDGQFNVSGSGASPIDIPFNNYGTVSVETGTLELLDGGTESNSFTVASGASLELDSGNTITFGSGATISGAGNFTISGGTADFLGSANVTSILNLAGGTLNFSGSVPITPVSATITGGTEEGSQTLQITNSGGFTWTGGAVAGMVEFNGGSVNGGLNLFGALINSGTLDWNGNLYMYGGVLTNLGTINVASGTSVSPENGSPDLQNDGQFNVPGPGTSTIGIPFYNQGAVTVGGGTLQLTGGGTESNSFTVASGASLELSGAAVNFNSGASISGAGNFIVGGGTANFSGSANVTTALNLTGGTLNVNGSGPITPASFSITGGTEQGAQALQVQSAGSFAWTGGGISGTVLFNGGTINGDLNLFGALVNSGTLALTGSLYMYGGVITNQGTINLAAASSMTRENGAPDIENTGQFNVSGPGTSTIGIPFINGGTLNIPSGTLAATGGFASTNGTLQFGISNTANFGTLTLSGNLAVNGTLNAIANGYAPKTGDTFPLITYGSESGLFTGFNLPPNVDWQVDYGATAFSLIVSGLNAPYLTLQAISPPEVPDGFTLLMLGPIGSNYSIQASSDPELRDWISLTNFTTVDTSFYYTDTSIATNAARVFRAMIR
jgi:hypothetical protein